MKFGWEGKPGTCLWCGVELTDHYDVKCEVVPINRKASPCCKAPLYEGDHVAMGLMYCSVCHNHISMTKRKIVSKEYSHTGVDQYGYFHSKHCAYLFATAAARNGYRFEPKPQPTPEPVHQSKCPIHYDMGVYVQHCACCDLKPEGC